MKHIQLFEEFVNEQEIRRSSPELKKLKTFAKKVSNEILNDPDLSDKFKGTTSVLDKKDYSPDKILNHLLRWGFDKSVEDIIKFYDWESSDEINNLGLE